MTYQETSSIIRWLYLNHEKYPSAVKWREAFVEFLETGSASPDKESEKSCLAFCREDEPHDV